MCFRVAVERCGLQGAPLYLNPPGPSALFVAVSCSAWKCCVEAAALLMKTHCVVPKILSFEKGN